MCAIEERDIDAHPHILLHNDVPVVFAVLVNLVLHAVRHIMLPHPFDRHVIAGANTKIIRRERTAFHDEFRTWIQNHRSSRNARILLHKEVLLVEHDAVRREISSLRHQAIFFATVDMQQAVNLHPYRLLQSYWVHTIKEKLSDAW